MRASQALGGAAETVEIRVARCRVDRRGKFGDVAVHMLAARLRQLAHDEVDRLDAVGAFVDRRDAGVAKSAGGAGLLDEAHAAMHLDAERGDLDADVGGECLGDRRQQVGALLPVDLVARLRETRAMSSAWAQE